MADEGTVTTDVMATPEQVLAAGGVSKRRRGASSSKRRSPSGQRRRAPTPEPPKDLPMDPDEKLELKLEASPTKTGTVKRISSIEKTIMTKRSQSSPGEGRQSLSSFTPDEMKQEIVLKSTEPAEQIEQRTDLSPTKTVVTKRKSTAEKTLMTKRSQSSPGEGRHSLPLSSTNGDMKQEAADIAAPHRKRPLSSDGVEKNDGTASSGAVKKSPFGVVQKSAEESAKAKSPAVCVEAKIFEENSQVKKHDVIQKRAKAKTPLDSFQTKTPEDDLSGSMTKEEEVKQVAPAGNSSVPTTEKPIRAAVWIPFFREMRHEWKTFVNEHGDQWGKIVAQRNRCIGAMVVMFIYCGLGGLVFRFTEGAFEVFYKCGVKRVKRDFVDSLWLGSHHLLEDEWKSQARRKLMELETQLHAAHEAGVTSYSGQRAWSFLNAVVYCLTVVTTIGYGHISPSTTTGRAITIVYAIFGIPMFLILLADFGKLFTRMIKFLWAFVRRVYYTGSCKKVRRTGTVQEVMKGVQLVYDFATFRRPSQMMGEPGDNGKAAPIARPEDLELQVPLNPPPPPPQQQPTMNMPIDGHEPPGTPALSTYEVDDEFNLPISVAIFILVIYIFVGAIIYWTWENWGFFESFYFVFISMSTIGFGDFVPQHPMYMMASIVYLVFGLALTSMCINVVQEKLSDSFRQASAKIGATIGLRVTEEDGTLTPVPPVQVELPEVHNTVIKPQST